LAIETDIRSASLVRCRARLDALRVSFGVSKKEQQLNPQVMRNE
jgi:hypothetical protein